MTSVNVCLHLPPGETGPSGRGWSLPRTSLLMHFVAWPMAFSPKSILLAQTPANTRPFIYPLSCTWHRKPVPLPRCITWQSPAHTRIPISHKLAYIDDRPAREQVLPGTLRPWASPSNYAITHSSAGTRSSPPPHDHSTRHMALFITWAAAARHVEHKSSIASQLRAATMHPLNLSKTASLYVPAFTERIN